MFKNNHIKKRVMVVIEGKIEEAQKAYEVTLKRLDDEYQVEKDELDANLESSKEQALEQEVEKILGKIL